MLFSLTLKQREDGPVQECIAYAMPFFVVVFVVRQRLEAGEAFARLGGFGNGHDRQSRHLYISLLEGCGVKMRKGYLLIEEEGSKFFVVLGVQDAMSGSEATEQGCTWNVLGRRCAAFGMV